VILKVQSVSLHPHVSKHCESLLRKCKTGHLAVLAIVCLAFASADEQHDFHNFQFTSHQVCPAREWCIYIETVEMYWFCISFAFPCVSQVPIQIIQAQHDQHALRHLM
jgi:hypothetical protein